MKTHSKKSAKKFNKKNRNKQKRRGPKYWMAMGTMSAVVAYSAVSEITAKPAFAQGAASMAQAAVSATQGQSPVYRFDIPEGDLGSSLIAFQGVTGLQVATANDKILGLPSRGVSGVYTSDQALQRLLSGTGVAHRFTTARIVTLELQGVAASIEVLGQISPSSPKYTEPLRDTPQTVTIIPKALIDEQGATTLRDVLRNVPGLTITAGEGGAPAGDNLTLRGFSARNDIFVDGARDLGPQARDPFNLEQVEIVKGPNSSFTGRGSAGGTINLVSKSPAVSRFIGGSLSFGTDATKRATLDVNLPIKNRTAFRLNLLGHDSDVAGRDVAENKRWGAAPSIMFGLGTGTRLTLSYFYLQQKNVSDYGIPWVPATNNALVEYRDRPAPVPRNTFYGFRDRDFEKMRSDLATVRIEHDFGDNTTIRNQLRFGDSTWDSIATPPRFANVNSTAINREMRSFITEDSIWDNQTDLRSKFSTGGIEHSLVAGLALTRENNTRQNRTAPAQLTTLYNPNPDDVYTGTITQSPDIGDITGNTAAIYAFDTLKLGKKFDLSGGLRWDRFDVEGVNTALAPVVRLDEMLSWRAGAVYKPMEIGSVYIAYGTSLSPSLEGLSYVTSNTAIEPEKTYNFEAGSKWDLFSNRLSLSGAIFRIDKTNARTPGILPDDPPQVLQGRQRVNGFELGASGSITRDLRIFGGYTFLSSEIVKSNTPAEIGKALLNTPRNSFSVWSTYQLPWGISLGGGPRYVGERFGNNANTRQVEGYWLIDAMASLPVTKRIDLRLNLYNMTNKYYFDRIGGGHIVPGAGRSLLLSAGFKF